MQLARTWLLLLSAAAFIATPAASGRTSYFCHMTGQVSQACCCLGDSAAKTCGAEVMARDCCERLSSGQRAVPVVSRTALHEVPSVVLWLAQLDAPVDHSSEQPTRAVVLGSAHLTGPPRFLAHCSFLI